jgi:uncharacterized membrane protein
MVFAHFFLRPAVAALPPPQRLPLMQAVLGRFFAAVLAAAAVALTGTGRAAPTARSHPALSTATAKAWASGANAR